MSPLNENVAFFLRSVDERETAFQNSLAALVNALAAEDQGQKKQAAEKAASDLNHLLSVVSTKDHPEWAKTLRQQLGLYLKNYRNSGASAKLINAIIDIMPKLRAHRWKFEESDDVKAVEFEEIYRVARDQYPVEEKFQSLLDALQQLVDSGQVDSISTINALEKLIATLRKNMKGSYFQAVGASQFAAAIIRKYLKRQLQGLPVVGDLFKATEDALGDLEVEMSEVHTEVRRLLAEQAHVDIPAIEYHVDPLEKKT